MTNPEQAVLDAIAGLELDEVGQIVKWQLEEEMARGEHLMRPPGPSRLRQRSSYGQAYVAVQVSADTEAFRRRVAEFTEPCDGCDSPNPHNSHLSEAGRRWLGLDEARRIGTLPEGITIEEQR